MQYTASAHTELRPGIRTWYTVPIRTQKQATSCGLGHTRRENAEQRLGLGLRLWLRLRLGLELELGLG